MRCKVLFLFCFLGMGVEWAAAQTGGRDLSLAETENYDVRQDHYDVRQYNSENGLPQNSATGLLLDKNNFLWITTQNGLVRFDGRRFRLYDRSNTPAIKSNRFSVIGESSQREVLLGSSFDPAEIYKVGPDYKLVVDTVRTRIAHKFIHINSKSFFDCTPLFRYYATARNGIDTAFLDRLCSSETFVILSDSEVVVRDSGNDWYYLDNASAGVNKLPVDIAGADVHVFFLKGIFCIFSERGDWRFFQHGKRLTIQVDKTASDLVRLAAATIGLNPILGPGGDQVILRQQNDIYELILDNGVLKAGLIFPDLRILDKLVATSFLYDKKNQRLFIATVTTGFIIVTKRLFRAITFNTNDRLNNSFKAFLLLPGKKILTQNGLLDRSNAKDHRLFANEMKPDGNCFYKAKDGSIWLSKDKQLQIYDRNFSARLAVDSLPLDSYIACIIEDSRHTVWVSTLNSLLKRVDGRLQYVLKGYPPFIKHNIESIAEVAPMILWIASRNGIYVYDLARDSIHKDPILPHVYARNIYRAKDSSIWVATYGNGFYKFENGKFIHIPLDAERYLSTAHAFLEDNSGFFWINTNHGLFRTRKSDLDDYTIGRNDGLYYYYFDKSYGFHTNEFNGGCNPASQTDSDGNFYFPSLDGIVSFDPARVHPELPDRDIFVDESFVDSESLDDRRSRGIKPDFHQIVVDITTPFYGLDENLKLEYSLDSARGKWYRVNRDGRITINRLPSGKYALSVRKNNGAGANRFTTLTIPFKVLPHWYHTWLFYIGLALAAGGLLFFLYRLRTRILLQQNIRLQAKVDERTTELEQSTLMKERLLSVIMHDLRSPMYSQSLLIDHLHENYHKLSGPKLDELFYTLKDSSNRIVQFSNDFLLWYDSQGQGFSIKKEDIKLGDFMNETTVLYRNIALRKGLYFDCDIPSGLVLTSDRNMLAIVIRNLVDNAVKYTGAGGIGISAGQENGRIEVRVKDTGRGMTASKIAEITAFGEKDMYGTAATFGYRFIMELARKLDGDVEIRSEPGKGTRVQVSFKA